MRAVPPRRSRAFAPGHVTGAFAPRTAARDPRARGSVGIGVVLELGVTADAEWRSADRSTVSVVAEAGVSVPISQEVGRRLVAGRPGRWTVRLHHDLPIGQGFGMSAAGALATARAIGQLATVDPPRCVAVAHLADLFGRGGLGGVAAILGGGVELRERPGIPPWGSIARAEGRAPLLVATVGPPVPSPDVLGRTRTLERIERAYRRVASDLDRPDLARFWTAAERFTDRVGLAPRSVRDAVRAVRRRGGRAAQAMFGRSLVAALPTGGRRAEVVAWLERRPTIRAVEIGVARSGARLLP